MSSKKVVSTLLLCAIMAFTILLFSEPPAQSVTIVQSPTESKLTALGTREWPTWSKEPSSFIWQFSEREVAYLIEGEVFVTPEGSTKRYRFKQGDLGYFEAGLRCKWEITKPLKKYVILEENKIQEIYWKLAFKVKGIARYLRSLLGSTEHVFMEKALNTSQLGSYRFT